MALDISNIQDPFHRELALRLDGELTKRTAELAHGSARRHTGDEASVAEKYAAQVAYIQAVEDFINVCAEIAQSRTIGLSEKPEE